MISHLREPPFTYIKIIKHDNTFIQNVTDEIPTSNILSDININPTQDPNINYNIMRGAIQYAKAKHMPQKIAKFNKYKHKKS